MEPRNYQVELFELAKKQNSIIYLGTGSGKTFISILMIKDFYGLAKTTGQKIIMVVPSIPLVNQQSRVIDEQCKFARVGSLSGDDGVDLWNVSKWKEVLNSLDIIVMIHQVLLDALVHKYITLSEVRLLIFDECHHAFKDNPYNMIMKEHYLPLKAISPKQVPHVMGLSASVVISQCDNQEKFIREKELLEKNMDSKVVTTENLDEYLSFVTQPEEIMVGFNYSLLSGLISQAIDGGISQIDRAYEKELIVYEKLFQGSASRIEMQKKKTTCTKKKFVKILNDVSMICNTLGIAGAKIFIKHIQEEVIPTAKLKVEPSYELKFTNLMEKAVKSAGQICETEMSSLQSSSEPEILLHFISPRVHTLLRILLSLIQENTFSASSFAGIVFVQRRESARTLCSLMKKISELDSRFAFISCAYVIGQSMGELSRGDELMKKIEKTICKFRSGEYNLIISTSVLEEGVDVKTCNLVVRFDEIQTYRSYVQSKGRARAKPSKFIIMHPFSMEKTVEEKICSYRSIERMSINHCHTVPFVKSLAMAAEEEEEDMEEEEEPYYACPENKVNSAKVSPATAISLLYQYISSITTDKFTTLMPFWEYALSTSRPYNSLSSMLEIPKYVCRVTLPHKTPLSTPIQGRLRVSRKKAKRSAALKACAMLHQIGELDDLFIPRIRSLANNIEELDDGLEDDDEDTIKPGTRKFRRYYGQKRLITNSQPVLSSLKVYIYMINMSLLSVRKHNPKRYGIYDPKDNPRKLGLCLVAPLSETLLSNITTLYSRSGLVEVSFVLASSYLTGQSLLDKCGGLAKLMDFTRILYKDVLKAVTPWMDELGQESFLDCRDPLVVPLIHGDIDTTCIEEVTSGKPFMGGDWTERVVTLLHKEDPQRYFVEEIVSSLSASSLLDNTTTFESYYSQKYGFEVKDKNQKLIRLSNADAEHFAYTSPVFDVKDNKLLEMSPQEFIRTRSLAIPEFVKAHSVPATLWKDLHMLPYILHRMNQIQNSIELCKKLCPPQLMSTEQQPSFKALLDLDSVPRISASFNHYELFKSLTLTNAGEEFDLERNEILGDAFLKIATSIYLYFEIKDKDEGYLSFYRSKIVGNRNLLRVGEMLDSLNLGGILNAVKLQPRFNWQVPFYNNSKRLEEEVVIMNNRFRKEAQASPQNDKSPFPCNFVDALNEDNLKELKSHLANNDRPTISRFYDAIVGELRNSKQKIPLKGKSKGMNHLRVYVPVSDKCIADAVEAIIGVFLLHNGCKSTFQMMATNLGINLYPNVPVEKNICEDSSSKASKTWFSPPKTAIRESGPDSYNALNALLLRLHYRVIEDKIGYVFKEKSFILQAFTHSSFFINNVTDSYERLEFLGDAVLDYLVTAYIFTEYPTYGPGKVTDARSAVVNNVTLALITLRNELHCHLLHSEPVLLSKIDAMIASVSYKDDEQSEADLFETQRSLLGETECPILEEIDVPKALGDIVESLLGAVFLDSGFNLETVWEVFKRLCPTLDSLIIAKPKNYVVKLYELYPNRVSFQPSNKIGSLVQKIVSLKLNNGTVYKAKGIGPNGKVAKNSAAKCLIRSLVKIKELPPEII